MAPHRLLPSEQAHTGPSPAAFPHCSPSLAANSFETGFNKRKACFSLNPNPCLYRQCSIFCAFQTVNQILRPGTGTLHVTASSRIHKAQLLMGLDQRGWSLPSTSGSGPPMEGPCFLHMRCLFLSLGRIPLLITECTIRTKAGSFERRLHIRGAF